MEVGDGFIIQRKTYLRHAKIKMKKFITIILLFIFLFNVTGYYFVQQFLLEKSNEKISIAIDKKQYNKSQLIELRVPLNMPYYQNTSFQREDGQINIKGITYNYVERKIENGYLVLKCMLNHESQQIKKTTPGYFAEANGINQNDNSKNKSGKSSYQSKTWEFEEVNIVLSKLFSSITTNNFSQYQDSISDAHLLVPDRPPLFI